MHLKVWANLNHLKASGEIIGAGELQMNTGWFIDL